jgi:hypothetical protein
MINGGPGQIPKLPVFKGNLHRGPLYPLYPLYPGGGVGRCAGQATRAAAVRQPGRARVGVWAWVAGARSAAARENRGGARQRQ